MNVLFVTASGEDYLADSLLLGFRELLGVNCIDYPKKDILYGTCLDSSVSRIRGCGFTLYTGLLQDQQIDRGSIEQRLAAGEFDLVIFSDIWRQYGYFAQVFPLLRPDRTLIFDGADSPQVYPYAGLWWRRLSQWFAPRVTKQFSYYKREWTSDSQFNLLHRLLPYNLRGLMSKPHQLRTISFSIPESKIRSVLPKKTKDFAVHCVDPEVAERIPVCRTRYAFNNEEEYYADLQASRFAITTKRAGWDCLRHYEIAANGCIPCFRDLDKKPVTCAPHGLSRSNCVDYHSAEDLMRKIQKMSCEEEWDLRRGALAWAHANSCTAVAKKILLESNA